MCWIVHAGLGSLDPPGVILALFRPRELSRGSEQPLEIYGFRDPAGQKNGVGSKEGLKGEEINGDV